MKKMVFTDKFIRNLKPEPGKREIEKSEGNGFSMRALASGSKTWRYIYVIDGQERRMNLGHYPAVDLATARQKFEDARRKVENGIDPMAEADAVKQERILAPTVAKLIEEYITRHAKRFKRSWEKDELILHRNLLNEVKAKGADGWSKGNYPVDWSRRKARDITKRDIIHVLEEIIDRGSPAMANNCFQIIRKMFNFAVEKDILQHSPCTGVKLPSPKLARDRALSEEEIKTFWQKLPVCAISGDLQRALKLILLTAQRPNEVAGMHTSEIDGDWWTLPVERQKVSKAKEGTRSPHRVFLSGLAKELIAEQIAAIRLVREIPDDATFAGYLFKTPLTTKDQPVGETALAVAVGRNLALPLTDDQGRPLYTKEGKPATINKFGIDKFTPHDLRRTAATFMAQSGEMDEVIDAVLNHKKQGVIKVYNQYRYDREKQTALESWERKLNQIITGKGKDNVVSISRGKGKAKAA